MAAIASVLALDLRVLRVVFNGAVPQVSAEASGDALNPANWGIEAAMSPGGLAPTADASVESVAAVSSTTVDLSTNTDLSPGRPYVVSASGITGLDPSPSSQTVTAYYPAQPAGRAFRARDMVPPKNWREDNSGDLERFIACIDDQLLVLLTTVDRWTDILDPERAPERFIDSMLADMGNPFRFSDLSIVDKRRLLLALTTIYQLKGTPQGMRSAINFFTGLDVDIIPYGGANIVTLGPTGLAKLGPTGTPLWVLGSDGTACQFEVRIGLPWTASGWALTPGQLERVTAVIRYMKPANMLLLAFLHPRLPYPRSIAGSSPSSGTARATWSAVIGQNGYHLYWSTYPGASYRNGTLVTVAAGTNTVDWSVTTGTRIYCTVNAVDGAGHEGVTSEESSILVT